MLLCFCVVSCFSFQILAHSLYVLLLWVYSLHFVASFAKVYNLHSHLYDFMTLTILPLHLLHLGDTLIQRD